MTAPLAHLWRPRVVYRARRSVVAPAPRPDTVRDAALSAADSLP